MKGNSKSCFVLVVAVLILGDFISAEDPYRFFTWNVTYGDIYPLGINQQVLVTFCLLGFLFFCSMKWNFGYAEWKYVPEFPLLHAFPFNFFLVFIVWLWNDMRNKYWILGANKMTGNTNKRTVPWSSNWGSDQWQLDNQCLQQFRWPFSHHLVSPFWIDKWSLPDQFMIVLHSLPLKSSVCINFIYS